MGLLLAALTAMLVARAPVPFVDKDISASLRGPRSADGGLPDPNLALRGPPIDQGQTPSDAAPQMSPLPGTVTGNAIYLLQAGAFRRLADAESMRARLALLGFEGQIQQALVNDETVYRVRVGPYGALDSMNLARAELSGSGIEVSVIRQ
ncbi:MAG: SPOR domain-containing protein [Burkholderiaceae bacterium]